MSKILKLWNDNRWLGISFFMSILLLLGSSTGFWRTGMAESFYWKGAFQIWRVLYDYTFGWLPLGSVYILFFGLLYILYVVLISSWFHNKGWKCFLKRVLLLTSMAFNLFYLLWGINYEKRNLAEIIELPREVNDSFDLGLEIKLVSALMLEERNQIGVEEDSLEISHLPDDLENALRHSQEDIFQNWGIPTFGRVRVRTLRPEGILLRISTAGVYIPYASEGHIDAGLHPIQWPFTMAHEMSHGYGITDEGESNFVAFITCLKSVNPFTRYSGLMSYLRYCLNNYGRYFPEEYSEVVKAIPLIIRKDIVAIQDQMDRFPDILPEVRNKIYDSYLKHHGVRGGIGSYSTIIQLTQQWKDSNLNPEIVRRTFPE